MAIVTAIIESMKQKNWIVMLVQQLGMYWKEYFSAWNKIHGILSWGAKFSKYLPLICIWSLQQALEGFIAVDLERFEEIAAELPNIPAEIKPMHACYTWRCVWKCYSYSKQHDIENAVWDLNQLQDCSEVLKECSPIMALVNLARKGSNPSTRIETKI